jgi:hypothetical protein
VRGSFDSNSAGKKFEVCAFGVDAVGLYSEKVH